MKAEIISIGTELLLGQITNTNASFLAKELQELGIESYFQTTVGDNTKRIHEVLKESLNRADIIITTGGLGPTPDDLTHEAIYSFFNSKPYLDKNVLNIIRKKFYLKGYKKMPEMNIKQAYKPKESRWIPNKLGTANGIIWKAASKGGRKGRFQTCLDSLNKIILTFPGVPREMYQMWLDTAKPYLKKISGKNAIYSKTLKFTGIGESALAEKIKKLFDLKNPTVAPYASTGEVKIRITAKAKTLNKAKELISPVAKKIISKGKKYFFGEDEDTLEKIIARLLTSKKLTLSLAESCTGGLISKRLTDIPGSSKYIKLNAVTYSNQAKNTLLKVAESMLKKYGAVSPQIAAQMAIGIKNLSDADIGLSVTGIAGPEGGSKEKPIGLVYFGLAIGKKAKTPRRGVFTKKVNFGSTASREEIRWLASQFALNWIRQELKDFS